MRKSGKYGFRDFQRAPELGTRPRTILCIGVTFRSWGGVFSSEWHFLSFGAGAPPGCPTYVGHRRQKKIFAYSYFFLNRAARPASKALFHPRSGENSVKHFLNCGNRWRAAHLLSTIRNARGLLLGDCEAIPRKDTWAAPVKLPKWKICF